MLRLSFNRSIYYFVLVAIVLLTSACGGLPAAMHESWTLVQLLTQEERRESVTETIDVRNCGVVERKSIECLAGTSNNFSFSLGADIGPGLVTVGPSIADGLGFDRSSGESLQLETPGEGYINRYVVTKEYRIVSGQARARSSLGVERDGVYTFQATCSLRIESKETLTCTEAEKPAPTTQPTNTLPPTARPTDILPNGEVVSPESLARLIGGNSAYWTKRGPVVWVYWDKGHNVTFRHPSSNTILTYWAGFPEPRNAGGCQIVIPEADNMTRYVKCPSGTRAEFEADGVGFHLIDYTGFFPR